MGYTPPHLEAERQDTIAIVIIAAVVFFIFFRRGYVYVRAIFDPAYRRRFMKRM